MGRVPKQYHFLNSGECCHVQLSSLQFYSKLSNKLSKPALFYSIMIPFIIFFFLFATVLYPLRESLHPTTSADWLQAHLPAGLNGLIAVFRDWTFSLFYVMAELWGSVALSLLFWGFANDVTKIKESKRFYTIFALGANVSLICAGKLIKYFSNVKDRLPEGVESLAVYVKLAHVYSLYYQEVITICDLLVD